LTITILEREWLTLWSVVAQATKKLNVAWFTRLKEGQPLTDSLREAKLEMLDKSGYYPILMLGLAWWCLGMGSNLEYGIYSAGVQIFKFGHLKWINN